MDKLKTKARSARNVLAERTSRGTGSGSLSVPHSSLAPEDNASTTAVNEGYLGPQPGTAARDFAALDPQALVPEPPTSLQSSVDAGKPVPVPSSSGSTSRLQVPGMGSSPPSSSRQSQTQPRRPSVGARQPSIGIRRMPSSQALRQAAAGHNGGSNLQLTQTCSRLPALEEECAQDDISSSSSDTSTTQGEQPSRLRRASFALRSKFGSKKEKQKDGEAGKVPETQAQADESREYASNMVDVLDTIDPEVQTLTSLTNVQNSLFIPNLGRWVNRRPTYVLRQSPSETASLQEINSVLATARQEEEKQGGAPKLERSQTGTTVATMATLATIDSRLSDSRFAVLPHGTSLEGWSKEDKAELNDHVRHMLHSKRSKFKRSMKGFGQYVRRPLGFLVTLYATLITLFGLAWVLFLIGWINVGGRQLYIINVIDNIMVALFAVVGDGLAPFRAVDTYHMIYIAHYHHYTWSRRKKEMLPELHDHNDLPASNAPIAVPTDSADVEKQWEFTVLTPKQQAKLEHHQEKFSKSHSFYKPHETETHHAFPLRLLIAIVVLLDCHSLFQIALGTCTWAIYYKDRPFALTTVILCCSITCNATGGLLIWIGDKKTRKKDVMERMNRQELTEEAMHKVEKKRERESESEREDEDGISKVKEGRHSLTLSRKHHPKKDEQSAYP
ncbi:uncharacterized protein BDR25DRAFT_236136 [Lindgomyces ingoldianus]|uniref:Uncharacterized protein n=1 Tax=Lindgomyces ingoldianus TaxID=673940 RepID=A0ACB6QKQ3_9PLEO|nr:uncharacterized protein BDR25DRAFT_236136 [Lindgomyces ingoldianus]KAF2466715.1 hypothetical protein BDR25DRAFT_236136 [Lindgomyces ingoldianus]